MPFPAVPQASRRTGHIYRTPDTKEYIDGAGLIQVVRGATRLDLAPDGRVLRHRDYWDTGEELFARLPLIGPLLGLLRRRMAAPPAKPRL